MLSIKCNRGFIIELEVSLNVSMLSNADFLASEYYEQ